MNVLLMDDEKITCSIVAEFLKSLGNSVRVADEEQEIMREVEHCSVDLVISDIGLPRMDGLLLVHSIQEKNPTLPVVLMSSFIDDEVLERAAQEGVDRVLRKPVKSVELRALVEDIDERLHSRQQLSVSRGGTAFAR